MRGAILCLVSVFLLSFPFLLLPSWIPHVRSTDSERAVQTAYVSQLATMVIFPQDNRATHTHTYTSPSCRIIQPANHAAIVHDSANCGPGRERPSANTMILKEPDGGKTVKSSLSRLETCRIVLMSAAVKVTYLYQCREHMTVSFHSVILPVPENPKSQDSMLQPEPCSADRGWKVVRRGADISAQ